jgi:hypothetical protein
MPDDVTLVQDESFDLEIWGGKSFIMSVQYVDVSEDGTETPIVLDSATDEIVGQIARYAGGPTLGVFTTYITDGPNGWFQVALSPAQTRKLVDHADYEVALITGDNTIGLFGGEVRYRRGVIR